MRQIIKKNITQKELSSLRINDPWKCNVNEEESIDVIFVGRERNLLTFAHKINPVRKIHLDVTQTKERIWGLAKGKRV